MASKPGVIPGPVARRSVRTRPMLAAFAAVALAAAGSRQVAKGQAPGVSGYPEDWTHHHLVFSSPGTMIDAVRNNSVAQWIETNSDIRYIHQQIRRNQENAEPFRMSPMASVNTPRLVDDSPVGDWSMLPGSGARGSAKVYPAKFGFAGGTASCTDFVVFPTAAAGSATVPSIVGYTNLYSGCAGTVPNVQFAVNLDAGTLVTSPVLSIDGSQVAFVAAIGGVANMVVLNIPASSTVTVSQVTTNSTTVNAASPCTAPCANWIAFHGSPTDTGSSPFYDYSANVLYVGDDNGVLHKFQNVFSHILGGGTNTTAPSEVTTAPWPVTVSSGHTLTSPVYDSGTSKKIFVGTGAGNTLASVSISGATATVANTASISRGGNGVVTDPIVDSTAQKVYMSVSHGDATTAGTTNTKQPYLYQFPTTFAASALPSGAEPLSPAAGDFGNAQQVYGIAFDNIYLSSATQTGNIYACGLNASSLPELYRIPITANTLATPTAGPVLSASGGTPLCSPITEIYNNSVDYIFVSQTGTNVTAAPISCPSGTGCLMSFVVTTPMVPFSTISPATTAHAAEASGTGGIIIDNTATMPAGTSQTYFSVLGSQSCSRTVTGRDADASTTITATSGIFTAGDAGATITGTGIAASTKISSVTNSTTAVLSKKATSSNAGIAFAITDTGGCSIQASQAALH